MKKQLEEKLSQANYHFTSHENSTTIHLQNGQEVRVKFREKDQYKVSDRLLFYNFLTGALPMSLSRAIIYNTLLLVIVAILISLFLPELTFIFYLFLAGMAWFITWSVVYTIRLEAIKQLIANWLSK